MASDSAPENSTEENHHTSPDHVVIRDNNVENVAEAVQDGLGILSLKDKNIAQDDEDNNIVQDDDGIEDDRNRTLDVENNGNFSPRIEVKEEKLDTEKYSESDSEHENFVEKSGGRKEFTELCDRVEEEYSEQEIEIEAPTSPSSSGYAGGRGSSSAASLGSVSGIEETREGEQIGYLVSGTTMRYGDEHKLAGFSATLQAIISFVENGGDRIRLVRAGNHQIIFLVKGPIYLVCISCTEEPFQALKGRLELLYEQVISLVGAQKAILHPDDMLLLSNFVSSSESFRVQR